MTKASTRKIAARGAKGAGTASAHAAGRAKAEHSQGQMKTSRLAVSVARFEAVMQAAEQSGLLRDKSGRIGGRVSRELVKQARRQTGIETDTDLIEFALASVALEDDFAAAFKDSRGAIDRGLKLGF